MSDASDFQRKEFAGLAGPGHALGSGPGEGPTQPRTPGGPLSLSLGGNR